MRDSTFTLQALHYLLHWEADEFMQFVADVEPTEDGSLQIMYGIDGRRDLTETTRDELSGYEGAHPVRTGTARSTSARTTSTERYSTPSSCTPAATPTHDACGPRASQAERHRDLARARPGNLGSPRKPQHYVSSKLMAGSPGPGREAGRDPRATAHSSRPGPRPPRKSEPTSSPTASATAASSANTTTPTRSTPPRCSPRCSASSQ